MKDFVERSGIDFLDGGRITAPRIVDEATDARAAVSHLWTVDVARGVFSRLTTGDAPELSGVIVADGRVAFTSSTRGAVGDIYLRRVGGVEVPKLFVQTTMSKHPNDWSPDGKYLIYDEHHPTERQNLWVVAADGSKPIPFLATGADETLGRFSPDGKWVAYSSDETERREVFVRGFAPNQSPAGAVGQWQISAAGGDKPHWSRDGKEIFFIAPDGMMMAARVKTGPPLSRARRHHCSAPGRTATYRTTWVQTDGF